MDKNESQHLKAEIMQKKIHMYNQGWSGGQNSGNIEVARKRISNQSEKQKALKKKTMLNLS